MDGRWKEGRVKGRTYGRKYAPKDAYTDGSICGQKHDRKKERRGYRQMDGTHQKWTGEKMDRLRDRCTNGWVDGRTDIQMAEGWTDG